MKQTPANGSSSEIEEKMKRYYLDLSFGRFHLLKNILVKYQKETMPDPILKSLVKEFSKRDAWGFSTRIYLTTKKFSSRQKGENVSEKTYQKRIDTIKKAIANKNDLDFLTRDILGQLDPETYVEDARITTVKQIVHALTKSLFKEIEMQEEGNEILISDEDYQDAIFLTEKTVQNCNFYQYETEGHSVLLVRAKMSLEEVKISVVFEPSITRLPPEGNIFPIVMFEHTIDYYTLDGLNDPKRVQTYVEALDFPFPWGDEKPRQ